MNATPRTDTFELGYFRKATSHVDDVFDFARHLEREVMEQARLNGMGSEREAGLLGKVGRLERENAALKEQKAILVKSACGEERQQYNTALMAFAPEWAGRHYLTAATAMVHRAQKAEAENAALREDKERLDWLEKYGATPICSRAAIDAARKEQP